MPPPPQKKKKKKKKICNVFGNVGVGDPLVDTPAASTLKTVFFFFVAQNEFVCVCLD